MNRSFAAAALMAAITVLTPTAGAQCPNQALSVPGQGTVINAGAISTSPLPSSFSRFTFTFEAWMRILLPAGLQMGDSFELVTAEPFAVVFEQTGQGSLLKFFMRSGSLPSLVASVMLDPSEIGVWTHVAFTAGAFGSGTIYIDGTSRMSVPRRTSDLPSGRVSFGSVLSTSPVAFEGQMDEVRFWNVLRSPQQINGERNTPLTGTEAGLLAYYDMQGSGPALLDRGPNGLHLNLVSNATRSAVAPNLGCGPTSPPGLGQPNGPQARLEVNGAATGSQFGPFVSTTPPGGVITMDISGEANQPYIMFASPGTQAQAVFVGGLGSVDLFPGQIGVLFDGTGFPGNLLFNTDSNGDSRLQIPVPIDTPTGTWFGVQAVVFRSFTVPEFPFAMTAAHELRVQ